MDFSEALYIMKNNLFVSKKDLASHQYIGIINNEFVELNSVFPERKPFPIKLSSQHILDTDWFWYNDNEIINYSNQNNVPIFKAKEIIIKRTYKYYIN